MEETKTTKKAESLFLKFSLSFLLPFEFLADSNNSKLVYFSADFRFFLPLQRYLEGLLLGVFRVLPCSSVFFRVRRLDFLSTMLYLCNQFDNDR